MNKKILSVMLVISLFLTFSIQGFAAGRYDTNYEKYKKALAEVEANKELSSDIQYLLIEEINQNYRRLNFEKSKYSTRRSIAGFPPESQTTYKLWTTYSKSVENIKKDGDDLIAFGNDLTVGSGVIGAIAKKFPLLLKATVVTGGVTYFTGRGVKASVSDLEDDAKVVTEVYFKWIDASKYTYKVKTVTYVEYDGERISSKSIGYNSNEY